MDHSAHVQQASKTDLSFWQKLEDTFSQYGFMPHGHCYLWKPLLVSLHVISDILIGLAYISISITLYWLVKKIKIPFNRMVLAFGVFIGACGLTHFMEVWNLWNADYWWSAWVKVITAIASVGTGVYLFKLRHGIVQVAEAAKLAEERRLDLEALTRDLEKVIAERTQEISIIANSIPQLAWKTQPDGYITWYNQRWYDYTGTTLEEMQGWGWSKVHDPAFTEKVTQKWMEHLVTGEPWEDTFPLKGKDGEYRWFLSQANPIRDEKGKILHWFGTNTDITDLKNAQEEREKLTTDLRKAVTARDEFLSIASHELKTPLTSLRLNAQMMKRVVDKIETVDAEKFEKFVEQVDKQTLRLNRLVEDMLDISRIQSGKLTVRKSRINLNELLGEMKTRFDEEFCSKTGQELTVHIQEEIFGDWDRFRLEQVVSNLLTNALRYGEHRPVSISAYVKDQDVIISVMDQGIGISKENMEIIFNRFERAGISPNEISGLGLGLFITRQIVTAHQGEIWVESEVGKGSTFYVRLPLQDAP